LGDLYCEKAKGRVNARLHFIQGVIHKDYLLHLYGLFSSYCGTAPKTRIPAPDKRTGKVYSAISFKSYSLPCFNELYHLFYPAGIKVLPLNIAELITPLGLAYLICDDGSFEEGRGSVVLSTNSFTRRNLRFGAPNFSWAVGP